MKKFEKPSMEKVEFESNDVITTSTPGLCPSYSSRDACSGYVKVVCTLDYDDTPECDTVIEI